MKIKPFWRQKARYPIPPISAYDKNIDRFYYTDLKEVQNDINTLKEEWSQTKGFMIALVVIGGMLGTIITWVLEYWGLRPMRKTA